MDTNPSIGRPRTTKRGMIHQQMNGTNIAIMIYTYYSRSAAPFLEEFIFMGNKKRVTQVDFVFFFFFSSFIISF